MRTRSRVAVLAAAFCFAFIAAGPAAEAADVSVLCSNGLKEVLIELAPQFERSTGNRITIKYDSTATILNEIKSGARPDLVILTAEAIEELIKQGKVAAGSRIDLALSGMGIAMRSGARKPDIRTVEAFKKSLLAAKSLALTKNGVSGIYFLDVFKQLGIENQMKPKTIFVETGPAGVPVAKGEAELAVQQISEILPVAGIELVGPLPPGLQKMTTFSSGVWAAAKEAEAAKALVRFLSSASGKTVIKKKGLEPQ